MRLSTLKCAAFFSMSTLITPVFAELTASLGIQSAELQVTSKTNWPNFSPDFSFEEAQSDESFGVSGEAAIGYRYRINDHYDFDTELFGQVNDAQTHVPVIAGDNNLTFANATATFDWIWGLRVRPGYQITEDTRFFIDGGLVWGMFDVDYHKHDPNIIIVDSDDAHKAIYGWRYGVGVEHAFNDFFAVSVDYALTEFDEVNTYLENESEESNGKTTYTPTFYTIGLNFKVFFGKYWF